MGHLQGSRNWGGRHDQNISPAVFVSSPTTFALQGKTLVDAEAVLFVDNRKGQGY